MPRHPSPEHIVVRVEFKALDEEEGVVEGHASVFDNIDQQDDIVHPGAFKKTIQERVPKRLVKFMDSHVYDIAHTLGTVTWAEEDSRGLRFRAKLSDAPSVQDVRQKLLEGHIDRLSIGYDSVQEDFEMQTVDGQKRMIRHLREVKLFEISAVPLAANEEARVLLVKTVVPFQDLPLANRDRSWDADAVEAGVREWAGGADVLDEMNWTRYRRAFVWYDREAPEQVNSYKLPIADVFDGRLTAIPRAVFAAAAAIQGARGGVDIPEDEVGAVQNHLARYYAKMRDAFDDDTLIPPWESDEDEEATSASPDNASGLSSFAADFAADFARELRKELGLLDKDPDAGPGAAPPTSAEPAEAQPPKRPDPWKRRARALELELEIARRRAAP